MDQALRYANVRMLAFQLLKLQVQFQEYWIMEIEHGCGGGGDLDLQQTTQVKNQKKWANKHSLLSYMNNACN